MPEASAMSSRSMRLRDGPPCALRTFELPDALIHCYGSHGDLLAASGLAVRAILARTG